VLRKRQRPRHDRVRIVHVSDCYLPRMGGIERQVHDLAVRQRAAGHDVEIVTSVAGGAAMTTSPIVVHRPLAQVGEWPAVRYHSSLRGRNRVVAGGYDVIHLHASTFSPLTFLTAEAAGRLGLPTVITVHSLWSYASPIFRLAHIPLRWRHWPLTWSAVSSVAADPLRRLLGPARPVAELPNGVDAAAWRIAAVPRRPERVVMVSVMRLAHRKRPRQLLDMLRQVRGLVADRIELEAVIIGDGPLRASLQNYLDRHRMNHWVRLAGQAGHAEIREIYRDADFYIAPATLESFGIAALEARCAGLPVIAHRASGVRDFITHDNEGMLADSDRDMVSCITRLASTPAMLHRMRDHNANTEPAMSWTDVLSRCEDLYATATAAAPRRLIIDDTPSNVAS
jgi:glycosyltransferase involved in cell wall biosynthesis